MLDLVPMEPVKKIQVVELNNKHCGDPILFKTKTEAILYQKLKGGLVEKYFDGRFVVLCGVTPGSERRK